MQRTSSQLYISDSSIGKLYQRHWQTLFIGIRRMIPAQEDAEDILLEVFLAATESETFPQMSEAHQEAWLRRVAYNKCMDYHRNKTRHPTASLDEYTEILYDYEHMAPEQLALRQEELAQLRKHLTRLSACQQEILRLRFVEGLRCTQIAGRTDKSEGAVRAVLARALNRLRGIYTQHGKDNNHG